MASQISNDVGRPTTAEGTAQVFVPEGLIREGLSPEQKKGLINGIRELSQAFSLDKRSFGDLNKEEFAQLMKKSRDLLGATAEAAGIPKHLLTPALQDLRKNMIRDRENDIDFPELPDEDSSLPVGTGQLVRNLRSAWQGLVFSPYDMPKERASPPTIQANGLPPPRGTFDVTL